MIVAPDVAAVARFRGDLARLCDVGSARVLVAVSGGGDSLALLLLAHAVLGGRCRAATVDHGMRDGSAAEAAFVARLCADRGIAHALLTLDPVDLPPGNRSAALRHARYGLLEGERVRSGMGLIATAHHADDQRETVLMRLGRGAGVSGLAGIRRRRGAVIRPLLDWRRAELAALVEVCGIVPVADPSNVDERYDRARLRRLLGSGGGGAGALAARLDPARLGRSADALADAESALVWAADRLVPERCVFEPDGEATFDPLGVPFELRRRLVARCIAHVRPDMRPDSAPRGSELAALAASLGDGRAATLADVACTVVHRPHGMVWRFRKSPPRRVP